MKPEFYTISKKQIFSILQSGLKTHRLFAPMPRKQYFSFEEIKDKSDFQKIAFEYDTTILPPKKVFMPSEEVMFKYYDGKITEPKQDKPALLFGVHPADIYGILQLDEIMTNPKPDYYYLRRRQNAIIIGVSPANHSTDFSAKWGVAENLETMAEFDIFLKNKGGDNYLAIAGTKKGADILKKAKAKKTDKKALAEIEKSKAAKTPAEAVKIYDQDILKKAVIASRTSNPRTQRAEQSSHDGKIWDELEKICMGCGICTYVCPLCYCFDVEDQTDYSIRSTDSGLSTGACSRCRKWDACTLPTFSEIAGGKNFRPALKNRYFNWYFHKFARGLEEYGQAQCVGCGRCSKFCPAGINVENVLDKIIEEYNGKSI